jgi:hypothetical protein
MEHRPLRPQWTCAGDGQPWPCPLARFILARHAPDPEALARHLLALLQAAGEDLGVSPSRLYRRFAAWTLPDDTRCRACGRSGHDVLPQVPPRLFPCDGVVDGVQPAIRAAEA